MMPPRVVVESCLLERGATGIQLSNDIRKLQIYAAGFEEHALNMLQRPHFAPLDDSLSLRTIPKLQPRAAADAPGLHLASPLAVAFYSRV